MGNVIRVISLIMWVVGIVVMVLFALHVGGLDVALVAVLFLGAIAGMAVAPVGG